MGLWGIILVGLFISFYFFMYFINFHIYLTIIIIVAFNLLFLYKLFNSKTSLSMYITINILIVFIYMYSYWGFDYFDLSKISGWYQDLIYLYNSFINELADMFFNILKKLIINQVIIYYEWQYEVKLNT